MSDVGLGAARDARGDLSAIVAVAGCHVVDGGSDVDMVWLVDDEVLVDLAGRGGAAECRGGIVVVADDEQVVEAGTEVGELAALVVGYLLLIVVEVGAGEARYGLCSPEVVGLGGAGDEDLDGAGVVGMAEYVVLGDEAYVDGLVLLDVDEL